MPGRSYIGSSSYRYGFNGKEGDFEVKNLGGSSYNFGARIYDPRLGRWLSTDPLQMNFAGWSPYNFALNKPIYYIDPDGKAPQPSIGPFHIGAPKNPGFTYDNGFLGAIPEIGYYPKPRFPTPSDIRSYQYWIAKYYGARALRSDLKEALDGYGHFLGASGKPFTFNLSSYLKNDQSGALLLVNAKSIAKKSAMELLTATGTIQMTSNGFSAGGPDDDRFPYPSTENWQKAIGAFNFWMSASVSAITKDGLTTYTMLLTINAEDRYNFNPGNVDIETGTKDEENGQFELTGLAKQFNQSGNYTEIIIWTVPEKKSEGVPVKTDVPKKN